MKKTNFIATTVTIPVALQGLLCDHFQTDNVSKAIYYGLIGFLSNSSFAERMDDFALHQLLSVEERRTMQSYSIRIPQELKQVIASYSSADTIYNVITVMLANFLYLSSAEQNPDKADTDNAMHLLRILGSKWNPKMQDAIQQILNTSTQVWANSIEPFAGALGIFSNFRFAFNEIINDIDLQKINLYRIIQDSYDKLLLNMLSLSADEETFCQNKEALKKGFDLNNAEPNLEATIRFLFSNMLSLRNNGCSFRAMKQGIYLKRLDAVAPLHERIKDAQIYGLYALDIIKKHMKDEDTIFIIDPPYLDTNVYENSIIIDKKYSDDKRKFDYAEHQQLAKLLRETHQRYGNDFIFFCRTTVTRKHDQKTKQITNSAELETGDRHMQGRIDDLYWGYGFYYIDVPLGTNGTVERIITSFNFDGATPYGNERGRE